MRLGRFRVSAFHALRRFAAAQEGSVAIILALVILPIVTLAGAAVDLRRVSAAKTQLQAVADTAALAGVDALRQGGNPVTAATNYVQGSYAGQNVQPTSSTMQRDATTVTVRLWMKVPMTIMKLARFNEISIMADATATYGAGASKAEIVLALDATQSMARDRRLDTAKIAAINLIDKVMLRPDGSPDPNVRVGLVPFAKYVNIGTQYNSEPWLLGPEWLATSLTHERIAYRCVDATIVTEQIQKTCYRDDDEPYDCSFSYTHVDQCRKYGDEERYLNRWFGCVGSEPPRVDGSNSDESDIFNQQNPARAFVVEFNDAVIQYDKRCPEALVRLTANRQRLKDVIETLKPEGETYIAPGLLWAWRLLSPRSAFADGSALEGVKKSIVLLTDGANTHSPYVSHDYQVHHSTDVSFANQKLLKICANAKAAGVKIYTIAFMLKDEVIKKRLKQCASTEANFYDAPSTDEMQRAFGDIGVKMTAMRLIR